MSLNTILATTPLTSTGYHLKATGTTIGNSLIYDNGTNVGIGNTNTSYKLEVTGTLGVSGAATFISAAGITNGNGLNLRAGGNTASDANVLNFTSLAGTINVSMFSDASSSNTRLKSLGNLSFHTGNIAISADNERMTITSAGNVGIGTNSPATTLHALGPIRSQDSRGGSFAAVEISGGSLADYPYISVDQSNPLTFITGAAERMRILSSGQVGINMTPGSDRMFMVKGSDATSNNFVVTFQNNAAYLFQIRNDGQILTGTAALSPINNTTASLANANIGTAGDLRVSTASSQRFKENINDWSGNGLETILALKPRTFNYKSDYYKHPEVQMLGLIAEEVAEVSEYLAEYENEDRTGQVENVRYANIVVPLIKAIQEQQLQIQNLQEQINILAK